MNGQLRKVKTIIDPTPVIEGAGVSLKRSLGGAKTQLSRSLPAL